MTTEGHAQDEAQRRLALNGSAGQAKDDARPTSAGTPEKSGGPANVAATGTGRRYSETQHTLARPDPSGNGLTGPDTHKGDAVAATGTGHGWFDLQFRSARPDPSSNGRHDIDTPHGRAVVSDGHRGPETQTEHVIAGDDGGHIPAPIIAEIRETWRERQDHHNAEKRLTLQIKARCRRFCGGDKTEGGKLYATMSGKKEHPLAGDARAANVWLLESRSIVKKHRKTLEKRLRELARQLPVCEWWCAVKGCSALGLAALIGEAGDLSAYANPGKLWKRFGLQVYRGLAPSTWRRKGLPAKEWVEVGYAPRRRAVLFTIGTSLFIGGGRDGRYRLVYDTYKARKVAELPDHTKKHIHLMAKRYMEKRLLKELWQAWRAAGPRMKPRGVMPPAN